MWSAFRREVKEDTPIIADLSGLYRVTRSDARRAGAVAAGAFRDDPMMAHLIPSDVMRQVLLPHLFEFAIRYATLYGEAYAISEKIEGVAAWLPNHRVLASLSGALRGGMIRLMCAANLRILNRFRKVEAAVQEAHFRLAPSPHWYLALISVEPELQGQGLGSALLRPMLARLDQEQMPCYLETQNQRNASMYERYAFRTLEEFTPPGRTRTWAMLREPQGCA